MTSISGSKGAYIPSGMPEAQGASPYAAPTKDAAKLKEEQERLQKEFDTAEKAALDAESALSVAKRDVIDKRQAVDAATTDAARKAAQTVLESSQTALDTAQKNADEARKIANQKKDALMGQPNFINRLFDRFENARVTEGGKETTFIEHLNEKINALGTGDSSDPAKLARYQKAIMMFTVHTNAQTSMIKSISDLDKGIVREFN